MFTHVVLFWLKKDSPAEARPQLLDDCRAYLAKIPTIKFIDAGRPAMTPRDVVDNSYDVGLVTVFDNREGHDIYQVHELHQQFIARNKPNFDRVLIYDFVA